MIMPLMIIKMPLRTYYLFKKIIIVVFIRNEYDIIQITLTGCSTLAKTHYKKSDIIFIPVHLKASTPHICRHKKEVTSFVIRSCFSLEIFCIYSSIHITHMKT